MALKFYVVPRKTVESLTSSPPIPAGDLQNYLDPRPGILDDDQIDIFCENSRSRTQQWRRFDLFERVDAVSPGAVVVFPFWLELFYGHCRQHISACLSWLRETYPNNVCVTQWNHDVDAATVSEFDSMDPAKFVLLNFNTSRPRACDLLLPFWAIETRSPRNDNQNRTYRASFIGQAGGELRKRLKYAFANRPGYYFSEDRRPEAEYLEIMRDSWFTLCPRGGGLSSYRQSEACQQESIPIIFADDYSFPFGEQIWREFSVIIPERLAGDIGAIESVMDATNLDEKIAACHMARRHLALEGVQLAVEKRIREMLA